MDLHLIACIVERGKANKVIEKAIGSGAQAATYFFARGTGLREKLGLFGKFIAPEKEIIFIVTKKEQTDTVFNQMIITAKLDKPGKGFAFIIPVEKAIGFFTE